ncbi:FAD-dependent oxidoreductase [Thalassotalea sp. 1_MG-2023]|uniref:flavin monoamine oxidase family protein n=1 Tax=Thalassotalea sp. 1_MG-2023 TaxID=3062680 RepID=UPI0026E18B1B|nr:FAD-dependent oxidoreductase [Thalassotalea sp. 1_MG-2023]MDO6428683.1 FAD-dependent oxidoreductase [Thalassotalea sp. 1_MG-2023]
MRNYSKSTKEKLRSKLGGNQRKMAVQRKANFENIQVKTNNKVVIIGAGISGLCAAHELEQKGYEVIILEAQNDHVGGRIRTFRKGNNYCEFGAMRIPEEHDLTLGYINKFGLKTRKFVQDNENAYAYIRSKRVRRDEAGKDALKSEFVLNKKEQKMSADDIWVATVVETLLSLSESEQKELYENHLSSKELLNVDQDSLYNNLKAGGFTRDAIEYVASLYGVTTYLNTGLSEHLREEKEEIWLGNFEEIEGGMDQLVQKFIENIRANIHRGAVVEKINNSASAASVVYTEHGETKTMQADWVICTIPLGVLSRLEIEAAFSKQKINAIRNVNYDSSSKIVSVTKHRFWEKKDNIYGGGSIWDGGLGHTWYPSDNAEAKDEKATDVESMLLASYTWGMHARRIDNIPEESINDYVKNELAKIHTEADMTDVVESYRWSWDNHEWSSGAFAFFNPGDHTDLHAELVKHEDRVLLAGEHCSLTHSWIQGALESAIEVCTHIFEN